jgi:hypothetical protein
MRVLSKQHWPIQFKMPIDDMDAGRERFRWLRENLEKDSWRYNNDTDTYCFATNDDAILFKLTCS